MLTKTKNYMHQKIKMYKHNRWLQQQLLIYLTCLYPRPCMVLFLTDTCDFFGQRDISTCDTTNDLKTACALSLSSCCRELSPLTLEHCHHVKKSAGDMWSGPQQEPTDKQERKAILKHVRLQMREPSRRMPIQAQPEFATHRYTSK